MAIKNKSAVYREVGGDHFQRLMLDSRKSSQGTKLSFIESLANGSKLVTHQKRMEDYNVFFILKDL